MIHPIAQIVALACHGNAAIRGLKVERFLASNSTCQFCDEVAFETGSGCALPLSRGARVADTPEAWFAHLLQKRCVGLRVHCFDGTWTLEAAEASGWASRWTARWNVWNAQAPNQRIWRVSYSGGIAGAPHSGEADLPAAVEPFRKALDEVARFSESHQLDPFTESFKKALGALAGTPPEIRGYHTDLAPDGFLSAAASSVLDACQHAWVFGGMGSWDDLNIEEKDEAVYHRLSRELQSTLTKAVCAASNTTAKAD